MPALTYRHTTFRVSTRCPTEFIDVTSTLEEVVGAAGLRIGIISVLTLHTTTAVIVNEAEPLLHEDIAAMLDRAAPRAAVYRHDDFGVRTVNLTADERINGHAHCQALLLGASVALNIVDGRLHLGRWQRVFFVELDGPREREVSIVALGETGR